MSEYSSEELREIQNISLAMAEVFLSFCKENGLLAYFCGGGCIGALRHQGFIPWDDDLDFFMPREDYEKFIAQWREFPASERYRLSVAEKDYIDGNLFATIRDAHTTQVKPYQKNMDLPHGIALDIIPLDGYAPTAWKRKWQCIHALIYSLFCAQTVPETHGGVLALGSKILLFVFHGKKMRYRIWRRAKKKMTQYRIAESSYITELCSGPFYMRKKYKSEWFLQAEWKKFEQTRMPIPIGYDGYLKEAFGNYMELPPKEKQVAQHDASFLDLENGYENYRGLQYLCNDKSRKNGE